MTPYTKSFSRSAVSLTFLILSIGTVGRAESANSWSVTGSMTTARSGHAATPLSVGRVIVGGGTVAAAA
jgi:hypothetical protein